MRYQRVTIEIADKIIVKMEASVTEGSVNNKEAFKSCGRTGRRGACLDTDIARDKLQEIIHNVEKASLDDDASGSTQANQGDGKS